MEAATRGPRLDKARDSARPRRIPKEMGSPGESSGKRPNWRASRSAPPKRCRQHSCAAWRLPDRALPRSEEHTSELQSQFHLVCRLLLEKKKKIIFTPILSKNKKNQT